MKLKPIKMKKSIYSVVVLMMSLFIFISCSADDDFENARYYVKYEVNSNSDYGVSTNQSIKYTSENGIEIFSQEGKHVRSLKWEGTYGPFKKGDAISLFVSNSIMKIHARIYVSRDKEPFVIKAEDTQNNILSLEYQIDF